MFIDQSLENFCAKVLIVVIVRSFHTVHDPRLAYSRNRCQSRTLVPSRGIAGTARRTTGRCRAGLRRGAAVATCAGPPACPERPPKAHGTERAAADGAGTGARSTTVAQARRPRAGADVRRAAQM